MMNLSMQSFFRSNQSTITSTPIENYELKGPEKFDISHVYDRNGQVQVYVGSFDGARNRENLKAEGITHIINCALEQYVPNVFPDDFVYLNLNIKDESQADLLSHLDKTTAFIDQCGLDNGKVLVHCSMGVSRSAAVAVAYVMKNENLGLEDAIAKVKAHRSRIRINAGFMQQLQRWADNGYKSPGICQRLYDIVAINSAGATRDTHSQEKENFMARIDRPYA